METAKTISVPLAGKIYLGLGSNASYEAAHRGEIPYIRVGKLMRVPVAAMERLLENSHQPLPHASTDNALTNLK